MEKKNICNGFSARGASCRDVWQSDEAADLLLEIVETERNCARRDEAVCTSDRVGELRREEKLYWDCLDRFCGAAADRLVEGRDLALRALEDALDRARL